MTERRGLFSSITNKAEKKTDKPDPVDLSDVDIVSAYHRLGYDTVPEEMQTYVRAMVASMVDKFNENRHLFATGADPGQLQNTLRQEFELEEVSRAKPGVPFILVWKGGNGDEATFNADFAERDGTRQTSNGETRISIKHTPILSVTKKGEIVKPLNPIVRNTLMDGTHVVMRPLEEIE